MTEKKYVGNGKKASNYDIVNVKISINKIIQMLYHQTNDKTAIDALNKFKEAVRKSNNDFPALNLYTPDGGKENLTLRLTVAKKKDGEDKYGHTHAVMLNEWVPESQSTKNQNTNQNETQNETQNDDLPF